MGTTRKNVEQRETGNRSCEASICGKRIVAKTSEGCYKGQLFDQTSNTRERRRRARQGNIVTHLFYY
jgi:hypothetical protein